MWQIAYMALDKFNTKSQYMVNKYIVNVPIFEQCGYTIHHICLSAIWIMNTTTYLRAYAILSIKCLFEKLEHQYYSTS